MFGKKGGFIWDIVTNQVTKFQREADGVYELNLWMKDEGQTSGFPRRGQ